MNNSARKDIDGNPDLSQTLFELVIDFGFIPEALKIVASEAKPYSDVLFPVLHEVLGWSEAYSILGDELIVENFDTLKKIAGDYTDALIASAANGSIISNIEQRRFQSVDASLSDLLLQTAPGHPSFKNWLVDGMSSVSADYWNEAILSSEDLSLMKLATRLGESLNKKLGTHLYDALRSIVSEASKGALDMMAIPKAHFQSALSWLDKIHSDTLKRNTRDHLLRTVSASVVNTFLDVFKPLLSDNEIMEEEADDFVRSFFPKVLSGEVDASRFTDLHASCPGMWVKARNQSREVFLESLKTTIANAKDDENRHQELEDLEQLLSSTRKKA